MSPERAQRVLLLLYTHYAGRLPTHVLLQIKGALWPQGDGPTVPQARADADPTS